MATFQLPAQNSYTPKPRAEVLAKRAAAKEAKKARQAAALAELRCDCGKQFQSKDALKKHRKDAVVHKRGADKTGDNVPEVPCDCGRTFKSTNALRRHRQTVHPLPNPFADKPAMVLMRPLGHVTPNLAKVLEEKGVEEERLEESESAEVMTCVLCECGRYFDGWPEMYEHLRGTAVHKPGGEVTVYTGRVRRVSQRETSLSEEHQEEYVGMEGIRVKGMNGPTRDTKCTFGQAFKGQKALRQHQRDSPKHKVTGEAPERCTRP